MLPAKPRKLPKQSRSKMLVQSVKDACRRVLYKEGAEALTTAHLAEVAGISVGSLYQYFPNLESVVAAVYDDIVVEYLAQRKEYSVSDMHSVPVKEAIYGIISRLVYFHQSLMTLNREFHSQYHRCFDLARVFNEQFGIEDYSVQIMAEAIRRERSDLAEKDLQLSAYMVMECGKSIVMDVMDRDPDSIFQPGFVRKVSRMCYAALPDCFFDEIDVATAAASDHILATVAPPADQSARGARIKNSVYKAGLASTDKKD